jgi:hypothetical protein
MNKFQRTLIVILLAITGLLAVLVLRLTVEPAATVSAQSARFDHVMIASTAFLYKGQQGMLVLDKRNGNVWFFPKANGGFQETFRDPIFVMRLQFEKIDQSPR